MAAKTADYRRGRKSGEGEGADWATEMSMDGWDVSKGDAQDHAYDVVRHLGDGDWADGWCAGFVAGATK